MKGKRKSLSSKHFQEEEDRISNLTDDLIHKILSFVDMQYAVQTSVLSKRWKNIWKSLPCMSINIWATFGGGLDRLICFVDNVFKFRDDSDIQVFELGFVILNDTTAVEALNRWIIAAVNHNIQDLTIILPFYHINSAYVIPRQLLNCNSLKKLQIAILVIPRRNYIDVILPESMSLPQIKTLSLMGGISISNSELHRLFSSCPLIETVTLLDCRIQMNNQMNILINSHSLRTLSITDIRHTHLSSADNLLTFTPKIFAPYAKKFSWSGFMTDDVSLENLSSVASAHIRMRSREIEDETADTYSELPAQEKEVFANRMMKLLRALQKVHHLTLSSGFLEVLLQATGTLYRQPLRLSNLETMKLEMWFTRGCLRSLVYLLKISPKMRALILISKSNVPDVEDDWEAGCSLTCMFSHLKFVEIREVEGCDNELELLRYLLKSCTVLENLNLVFQSNSSDRKRQLRWFKRNLKALPTASSSVTMKFK